MRGVRVGGGAELVPAGASAAPAATSRLAFGVQPSCDSSWDGIVTFPTRIAGVLTMAKWMVLMRLNALIFCVTGSFALHSLFRGSVPSNPRSFSESAQPRR